MTIETPQHSLQVRTAQRTLAGAKACNEDCVGLQIPTGSILLRKGIVAAIADGVSAAESAQEAAEIAVTGFITDYYSTPDSWSVKQSAHKVLVALNRWLFGQGQKYTAAEKGYVCTFSSVVFKSRSAYLFHVGDSRIYRWRDSSLEQLTRDHTARIGPGQSYLARALGIDLNLDVDFKTVDIEPGDIFLLTTDGIHDYLEPRQIQQIFASSEDLEVIAQALVEKASANQSPDNLSCQLIAIDQLGQETGDDVFQSLTQLPFPPELEVGYKLDGWRVLEQIHGSQRSQLFRVEHVDSGITAIMKTPSVNYEDDPAYIERFIMEEWVGRRITSDYVVKVVEPPNPRRFLYYLIELVPGPTFAKLIAEPGLPEVTKVTQLAVKLVQGLRAFHRKETLHQDIKPDNLMLRGEDPVIIDFGSVYVAGVDEIATTFDRESALGTLDYSAPEYRLHRPRTEKSDQFSLAVVLYEMLTKHHPFGDSYSTAKTTSEFLSLKYIPAYRRNPLVPVWIDGALRKALQISGDLRYESLSEFVRDLQYPNPEFLSVAQRPLLERDPVRFWQCLSGLLFVLLLVALYGWLH